MMTTIMQYAILGIPAILLVMVITWILKLRRIVPTNMVHIVQRGKNTVSYGKGKEGGNVYYAWPSWLPILGVEVRALPVSNFNIDINNYTAYDKDRLPFNVHVKAFFHIEDTNKAAEKVASYEDLNAQLEDVVKGAIRSILANEPLHKIMEERQIFGEQFTKQVNSDVGQWGVSTIKNLELMDIKDVDGSHVIEQIMEIKKSEIEKESRVQVAKNNQESEQAELLARQEVAITKAESDRKAGEALAQSQQAVGIAQAESEKKSGIAKQEAASDIAKAEKSTAEQKMEVLRINQVKQSEINRDIAIINTKQEKEQAEIKAQADKSVMETAAQAEKVKIETAAQADKIKIETAAEADLASKLKNAEGVKAVGSAEADVIKAKGVAQAEAEKLLALASVTAQTELAKEIGTNDKYQQYLIELKKIEVTQIVGIEQAKSLALAMNGAEVKLLVNSGDVHSGMSKLSDIFTSKGASSFNGFIEAAKQTPEGQKILSLIDQFGGSNDDKGGAAPAATESKDKKK